MSTRRLFAAVRDLDPPGGGAERSLAALLNGIAAPGPTLETAPTFVPMSPAADAPTHPAWTVSAFASLDRGEPIGLLEPNVGLHYHRSADRRFLVEGSLGLTGTKR
jgi:hypothetical protein